MTFTFNFYKRFNIINEIHRFFSGETSHNYFIDNRTISHMYYREGRYHTASNKPTCAG
jgi:hypothetical protein